MDRPGSHAFRRSKRMNLRCSVTSGARCPTTFPAVRRAGLLLVAITSSVILSGPARADLSQWFSEVNAGSPANFAATNITPLPRTMDIGTMTGDISYEFIVNGNHTGRSSVLIGSYHGLGQGVGESIKFNQFDNTGNYGVTDYDAGYDYDFGIPATFGADVMLDFISSTGAGVTSLYVNGDPTGATAPMVLRLSGVVGVGATMDAAGNIYDSLDGRILGMAVFNRQLTDAEIRVHAEAWLAVAPVYTIADVGKALQIAGGTLALDPSLLARYNVDVTDTSASTVDVQDAVRIARKVAGVEP